MHARCEAGGSGGSSSLSQSLCQVLAQATAPAWFVRGKAAKNILIRIQEITSSCVGGEEHVWNMFGCRL